MANKRFYGYYIKGNQLALSQKDVSLSGSDLDAEDYGMYKSPTEAITDGLELQYTYAPTYRINDASDTITATAYNESGETGLLVLTIPSSIFAKGAYIVITGSPRWNGLHRVNTAINGDTALILDTKYNGGSVTENFTVAKDVSALVDESSELDLPRYQAIAVSYYVKAKLLEDSGDIDGYEYFMRQFKRQLEKSKSALKKGPYRMGGFMNHI